MDSKLGFQKYCRNCQDYYPADIYPAHMKQHQVGDPSIEHKQYLGTFNQKDGSDYMICILHQKKTPCPIKGCKLQPFGCTRKSVMIANAKKGFFHTSDIHGNQINVPIDFESRTVVLLGATIKLKI